MRYKLSAGTTYKHRQIQCLSDLVELPPHQCGIAFTCIDASIVGNWRLDIIHSRNWFNYLYSLTMRDSEGNYLNVSAVINAGLDLCNNGNNGSTGTVLHHNTPAPRFMGCCCLVFIFYIFIFFVSLHRESLA